MDEEQITDGEIAPYATWRRIYDHLLPLTEPGQKVTHDDLLAVALLTEKTAAYYCAVKKASRTILVEQQRYWTSDRPTGYICVLASEHRHQAANKAHHVGRVIVEMDEIMVNVAHSELDDAGRAAHNDYVARTRGWAMMQTERLRVLVVPGLAANTD